VLWVPGYRPVTNQDWSSVSTEVPLLNYGIFSLIALEDERRVRKPFEKRITKNSQGIEKKPFTGKKVKIPKGEQQK